MLRIGKFFFIDSDLCKLLHRSESFNELLVFNYDKNEKQLLDLHAANLIAKPALKIGEVAKLLNKSPDTIRKWEVRGWIDPQKQWNLSDKKSVRFYTAEEVEAIRDVIQFVHIGRPRKDKRVTNSLPDKGNFKIYLKERIKKFNV